MSSVVNRPIQEHAFSITLSEQQVSFSDHFFGSGVIQKPLKLETSYMLSIKSSLLFYDITKWQLDWSLDSDDRPLYMTGS